MRFEAARMDGLTMGLTILVIVVLLAATGLLIAVQAELDALTYPLVALNVAVLGMAWAMAPKDYTLDGHTLTVGRNAWPAYVTQATGLATLPEPRKMGLRVLGSGGAWGWYGRFRRKDVGFYRMYATSLAEAHLLPVQTEDGVLVVSPADRSAMADAIGRLRR